jgi:hypothetical protein
MMNVIQPRITKGALLLHGSSRRFFGCQQIFLSVLAFSATQILRRRFGIGQRMLYSMY